jgi:hypothetical protein
MQQRWVHPEKRRYYRVELRRDLLEDLVLIQAWGALGSRLGQVRQTVVESEEEGERLLRAIERRRQQRGYVIFEGEAVATERT